ncbi:MAG: ADP-forming succinate--CoA ligase subunit beta [Deltaproteobacteria bacterium]|nr:ADP-forming succinate--CoA ligase subunit beta [Deltaproteobacteria bacterium]
MKIHEHQAKEILAMHGVLVPRAKVAFTPDEAEAAAKTFDGKAVVKAQVHAGGRGKAGGVKVVNSAADAREVAERLLGQRLVTHQTGAEGQPIRKVLVEQQLNIARELYAGLVLDRESALVTLILSAEGGVEIEDVARTHPERILRASVDPLLGLMPYQIRNLAFQLDLTKDQVGKAVKFLGALYKAFMELDASMLEINPLVVTGGGELLALDAKMNFDDNALYRHPELAELRDVEQEDPAEVEASRHDLSYVRLDGNIGCMVNGAGLAMATMDIIKLYGAEPANFLDVGGGTDAARVEAAFKIILSDKKVDAVLVNIFGGIVKCDVIAEGVVSAVKQVGIKVPLVVRLQGTNDKRGREILAESGLDIVAAETMREAAERVVAAVKGERS